MACGLLSELTKCIEKLDNEIEIQKSIRDNADDLDDLEKSREINIKSSANIRNLKKWRSTICDLLNEIESFGLFADEKNNSSTDAELDKNNPVDMEQPDNSPTRLEPVLTQNNNPPHNELTSFTLLGKFYRVDNGEDFLVRVCSELLIYKPYKMVLAAIYLPQYFTEDRNDAKFSSLRRLPNGIYVNTCSENEKSIMAAHEIVKYCDIPENEFIIS